MRELSVFCDESGDFGPLSAHSPLYIVSLVFHDQSKSISEAICNLEKNVAELGFSSHHAIHSAPLIRREQDYANLDWQTRRKLFGDISAFMRRCDVSSKTFLLKKKEFGTGDDLADRIAREMGIFIRENLVYFQSFDKVIVYYDRGQKEITRTLRTIFSSNLSNVEFRIVKPEDYHLFQVADLVCTLELLDFKHANSMLNSSELVFFDGANRLKKNFLKILYAKRM